MQKCYLLSVLLMAFTGLNFAQDRLNEGAISSETMIFPLQDEHAHGSSLVELPNGDILAVWFQGSGERKADDVRIMGARLQKGAEAWSTPFQVADTPGLPDCNPVLFLNSENKLFLVWIAVLANTWENSILRVRTSTDYLGPGAPMWNWQDNMFLKPGDEFALEVEKRFGELPESTHGWAEYAPLYDDMIIEASRDLRKRSIGWMTRIHPLILANGRILLPLYSDGFNFYSAIIDKSINLLNKDGFLFFEAALGQSERIISMMKNGGYKNVTSIKDYADIDRIIYGKLS